MPFPSPSLLSEVLTVRWCSRITWDVLGALTEGLVTSRRFMRNLKTELKPQVVNGEWRGAGAPVYRENGNAGNKYYGSFNGKSYSDADNVISEQPVYVANQGRTVSTKLPLSCLSTCTGSHKTTVSRF